MPVVAAVLAAPDPFLCLSGASLVIYPTTLSSWPLGAYPYSYASVPFYPFSAIRMSLLDSVPSTKVFANRRYRSKR